MRFHFCLKNNLTDVTCSILFLLHFIMLYNFHFHLIFLKVYNFIAGGGKKKLRFTEKLAFLIFILNQVYFLNKKYAKYMLLQKPHKCKVANTLFTPNTYLKISQNIKLFTYVVHELKGSILNDFVYCSLLLLLCLAVFA